MKTKEELNALKEEDITQVSSGVVPLDTNTDVDRSSIQKEINASIQQINDDALLPFN